jgi:hypothetical protein
MEANGMVVVEDHSGDEFISLEAPLRRLLVERNSIGFQFHLL